MEGSRSNRQRRTLRSINKTGRVWETGMTPKVLWEVVRVAAKRAAIEKLAPHDLRRYAESRTMPYAPSGGRPAMEGKQTIRHSLEQPGMVILGKCKHSLIPTF